MDYERYYHELIIELQRSSTLIQQFHSVEYLIKNKEDKYLYDVFLLNAVPSGAGAIIEMLRKSANGIDLDVNRQEPYIVQLHKYASNNKTAFIEVLKSFGDYTEDRFFEDLLVNYRVSSNSSHLDFNAFTKKL